MVALTFWFGMYLLASSEYDVKGENRPFAFVVQHLLTRPYAVFYLVFLAVVLGSSHTTTIFLHATSIAKGKSTTRE